MAASSMKQTARSLVVILSILAYFHVSSSHEHSHDHGHHHGHAHDHGDEQPAHFKYSQQANEANAGTEDVERLQPQGQDTQENHHQHDNAGHAHDHGHGHAHDHGHGHGHGHSHGPTPQGPGKTEYTDPVSPKGNPWAWKGSETMWLWMKALGSTALVSAAPVVILIFIPLDNTEEYRPMLKVLLSFASGGLLGDAFLHLIPHAISPHTHGGEGEEGHGHAHENHGHSHGHGEHDHSHDMGVGMWVLTGLIAFLVVEKFVRYVKGGHGHSHSHSHTPIEKKVEEKKLEKTGNGNTQKKNKGDGSPEGKKTNKAKSKVKQEVKEIEVAGYLNLAADFAHNFTDGLAIGASYLAGQNVGIITTVTILLHEVPHEIGDFAILVKSGCSKRKAMMLQFSTAAGAMMGTLCSLMAEGAGEAAVAWILPFTAGGFIYIATVSVIPELLEDSKLMQSVKEIFAMLTGVFMMVLIAKFE